MAIIVFECDVCGFPWDSPEEADECCDFERAIDLPDEITIRNVDGVTMMEVPAKLFGKHVAINRDGTIWAVTHVPTGIAFRHKSDFDDAVQLAEALVFAFPGDELDFATPEAMPKDVKKRCGQIIKNADKGNDIVSPRMQPAEPKEEVKE